MTLDLSIIAWIHDPGLLERLQPLLARHVRLWRNVESTQALLQLLVEDAGATDIVLTDIADPALREALRETPVLWLLPTADALDADAVWLNPNHTDSQQLTEAIVNAINLARTQHLLSGSEQLPASDWEQDGDMGFEIHFQPQWTMDGSCIRASEALLRWHGLEVAQLRPESFIAAAEARGQIARLGDWIIQRACAHAGHWAPHWPEDMMLALNLTQSQLDAPAFTDMVLDALVQNALDAYRMEFELNAKELPVLAGQYQTQLFYLADLGFSFTLDRVGNGLFDPALLHSLPLRGIKIDRTLVHRMTADAASLRLVQQLAQLAQRQGLYCAAVGVEHQAQWDLLRAAGCQALQGFLLADAMPAAEFSALLQAQDERRRSPA